MQRVEVLEERRDVGRGEGVELEARRLGAADGLVVDVRQVHHLGHAIAEIGERAAQQILEDEGAQVPDVHVVVDRRAAGVHARFARPRGLERCAGAPERVVEPRSARHGGGRSGHRTTVAEPPTHVTPVISTPV